MIPKHREIFRIEELVGRRRQSPAAVRPDADATLRHAEIVTELRALREALRVPSLAATAGT